MTDMEKPIFEFAVARKRELERMVAEIEEDQRNVSQE